MLGTHSRGFRVITGIGMAVALGAEALTAADPSYPVDMYPSSLAPALRQSEVAFTEDDESRRYGFDVPFPEVARQTFSVEAYGARPDGTTDCTAAFAAALAAALATGQPTELVFPNRGRYYFRPDSAQGSDEQSILNVRAATNLLIRGQGPATVLVAGDPALGLVCVTDGATVMLRDLAIDYNPLPFTQGTVTEVNAQAGTFSLRLSAGYPTPDRVKAAVPEALGGYRLATAGEGRYRWPTIGGLPIKAVSPLADGTWRFETDPATLQGYMAAGDAFVYVGRRFAQQALTANRVRGFYVKDVVVHASPTCGFGLSDVDGVCIDGYADCAPAGSTRWLASNADGLFVHGARAGLTVKNCHFMGQGDDCINLHCYGFGQRQVTRVSDTEILFAWGLNLRAGDRLEIMDITRDRIKGQIEVVTVTLESPDRKQTRCRLATPLSAVGYDPATDSIFPVALAAGNFKIVHNYFGQNRSRCLLIQARGGLIAANTFENAEGYGVVMGYGGTAWPEGVIPSQITIRDNLFRNVTGVGLAATIEANGYAARYLHELVIRDNRFLNPRKMAISAQGCDGLQIVNNTVSTDPGRRNTWNHPQWYPVDCSLFLENCTGVLVDRYSVRDANLQEGVVYIGKACAAGSAGVEVREVTAETAAGVPAVKDAR